MPHRRWTVVARGLGALVVVLSLMAALTRGASARFGNQSAVYALTNDANGNALVVFDRAGDGSLTAAEPSRPVGSAREPISDLRAR